MTPTIPKPRRVTKLPEDLADEFRTLDQAAEMLGCGRSKIYTLAHQGRLELVKFDHFTRVTTSSLLKLLKAIRKKPARFASRRMAVVIFLLLLLAASAQARIACHTGKPPGAHVYWSWRQVDGRACWHAGGTLSKTALFWPAAAPRQAQTLPAPAVPLPVAPVPAVPLPARTTPFVERWSPL